MLTHILLTGLVLAPQKAPVDFDAITPKTLEAHVRFLASDLLEGRGTPSKGLDIAAEYIASQFQLAGVKPIQEFTAASHSVYGFFQASEFESRRTNVKGAVRNVIGILPGTDSKLKDTYILVTAHYDHLGVREGEGDQIYNGANDDGSGTAAVIECARALAAKKPKRSVIFMCFWGEEAGLQGSRYFVQNPLVPLKDIAVNVNIEQIGRTDDTEGPRVSEFNLTGFDYTDLSGFMSKAAEPYGVKVSMHPKLSGPYFNASDNAAFANAGVPANTVSTAYNFPDYHAAGDHWDKLDYVNMAKITRAVCAGVLSLANSEQTVKWIETNERTKKYVDAWKKLQGID